MKMLFFVLFLIFVLVFLQRLFLGKSGSDGRWPYRLKQVLSVPEQVLYHRLIEALPGHVVLAQVGLTRVLAVDKVQGKRYFEWFNKINKMSLDYVVCTRDMNVLCAVELDDSSHDDVKRRSADAVKNKALESAGVRLIRWHVKSMPDSQQIIDAVKGTSGAQPITV